MQNTGSAHCVRQSRGIKTEWSYGPSARHFWRRSAGVVEAGNVPDALALPFGTALTCGTGWVSVALCLHSQKRLTARSEKSSLGFAMQLLRFAQ